MGCASSGNGTTATSLSDNGAKADTWRDVSPSEPSSNGAASSSMTPAGKPDGTQTKGETGSSDKVSAADAANQDQKAHSKESSGTNDSPARPSSGQLQLHSLNRREKRSNSVYSTSSEMSLSKVAAGHGGASILRYVDESDEDPTRPKLVMKVYDEIEATVYRDLAESGDELGKFAAQWFGEVEPDHIPEDLDDGVRYMKLTNLLKDYGTDPHVMDCKIGIRSFLEDEAQNKKPRTDLFTRMMAIDPDHATEEEKAAEACTKFRWMSFNDRMTTTATLGARIDGICNSEGSVPKKIFRDLKTLNDTAGCIAEHFFKNHRREHSRTAATTLVQNLKDIRDVFERSVFAKTHNFVGMSILFVLDPDGPGAAASLIDFAKTLPLPEGVEINHRNEWTMGNHEDGVLTGIDNMISCWTEVVRLLNFEAI